MSKEDKNKIVISDEAIKASAACKKGHPCLKGDSKKICSIDHCVGGKVHFVRCKSMTDCGFRKPFGHGFYCTCPIRKELYDKYQI